MNSRFEAIIHGNVQGVSYRAFAFKEASRLKINGYTKNLMDGTVKVVAEAPKEILKEFLEKLGHGPSLGSIEKVKVDWSNSISEFQEFSIEY